MPTCPSCGKRIEYQFLTRGVDENPPAVPGWPKSAWGQPGARWMVCHAFDATGREFWHIRIRGKSGGDEHRLAWMASPSMNGSQRG